jgi:hypothetical protein
VPADQGAGFDDLYAEDAGIPSAPTRRMSLEKIRGRDALLTGCVLRLKMTASQIADFSKAWEHPFFDERDVWRRVNAIGLGKKIKHVARQSLHDEWNIRVFTKIARDAIRDGIQVYEISKEHRIGGGSGIRSDFRFRLDRFLFYQEGQETALTYMGWKAKLGKYVRLRKTPGVRPFRVLITMQDEHCLNTVLGYAKEVMAPHPNLTLFLFAYMPDLLGQYDVVREDVWRTHRYEPVSLV